MLPRTRAKMRRAPTAGSTGPLRPARDVGKTSHEPGMRGEIGELAQEVVTLTDGEEGPSEHPEDDGDDRPEVARPLGVWGDAPTSPMMATAERTPARTRRITPSGGPQMAPNK